MENETNKIKEQIVGLAKVLKGFGCDHSLLDEIINQPEEPQGYQGLNKWYFIDIGLSGDVIFPLSKDGDYVKGYGKGINGNWYSNENCYPCPISIIERLATPSEIQQAILKGCEQNGIVKGASVKWKDSRMVLTIENFESVSYDEQSNVLRIDNFKVFDNGKFAEVVKENAIKKKEQNVTEPYIKATEEIKGQHTEITDKWQKLNKELDEKLAELTNEDIERWYNNRMNKSKPSDKELLKECRAYLNQHINSYGTTTSIANLLTKLNKHLNHENK